MDTGSINNKINLRTSKKINLFFKFQVGTVKHMLTLKISNLYLTT